MIKKILVREITIRKPGTKTGKIKIKYGIPEDLFLKLSRGETNEKTRND